MLKLLPHQRKKLNPRLAVAAGRVIGAAAGARRVVLFGSAARNELHEHSDWDFLVIVPPRRHRMAACVRARKAVYAQSDKFGIPPMDILVAHEPEVERWRDCQYSVIKHALDEGREVWRG